jgi:CSLREA domain-containing protein
MRAGKLWIAIAVGLIASLFLAASAMADIRLSVTTTADNIAVDGQCSLREAINASNGPGAGTPTADCPTSGTPSENQIGFAAALGSNPVINLTALGDLQFGTNDVTVTGPATVNGFAGFRVITSNAINLTLNSLTISNGSENIQSVGGGIRQINGRLFLNSSAVSGNTTTRTAAMSADTQGGGIYSTGPVTLTNSIVTGNQAISTCTSCTAGSIALGGGVEVSGDDLTMENSVASGNKAIASGDSTAGVEADGGGVRTDGDVQIDHSTISGNLVSATSTAVPIGAGQPTVQGGGMLFHGAASNVHVELSTIANNLMKAPASTTSASQRGGGIEDFDANTAGYISDTIAGNGIDPLSQTAGIQGLNFQSSGAGAFGRAFANTIIANPVGSAGDNCAGDEPYSTGGGPNLEFPVAGTSPPDCFTPAANTLIADPQLGALGNNGGATPTMVPAPTSPVVDQGTASDQNDLTQDQRGLTRPVAFSGLLHPFDGSDIGAVEVQSTCGGLQQTVPGGACVQPLVPPVSSSNPGPTGQRAAALKKCKKKKHGRKHKKCVKRANRLPI